MLGTSRDSHTITKDRTGGDATSTKLPSPAVRIVHVFAPEIIKTDPANFRELVQKLTGKPMPFTPNSTRISAKKKQRQQSGLTSDGPSSPTSSAAAKAATTLVAKAVKDEGDGKACRRIDMSSCFDHDLNDIDSFVARLIHADASDFSESLSLTIETEHHMF